MRSGWRKTADKHQVPADALVSQNETGGIIALAAQTQQILGQALRQIEFAADRVIDRLRIGNLKEFRGGTQLLPQHPCAGMGLACFGYPLTACNTVPYRYQIRRGSDLPSGFHLQWRSETVRPSRYSPAAHPNPTRTRQGCSHAWRVIEQVHDHFSAAVGDVVDEHAPRPVRIGTRRMKKSVS
jgi:hypothetical protein